MNGAFDFLVFAAFFAPMTLLMALDVATSHPQRVPDGLFALPPGGFPSANMMPAPDEVGPHGAFDRLRRAA